MENTNEQLSTARWMKATFFGWFLGIFLIIALSGFFDSIGIEGFQFYLGIGMGASVGFMQWRVLKNAVGVDKKWIWYSILGLGIPFLLNDLLSKFADKPLGDYYLPVSIAIGGITIGVLQHLILNKHSSKSKWWILGGFAGWVLAAATVLGVDYTKYLSDNNLILFIANLLLILGGGVVLGFVTGKILTAILKQGLSPA